MKSRPNEHSDKRMEQYFFSERTLDQLTQVIPQNYKVLCLCCPALAIHLDASRKDLTINLYDQDQRFNDFSGFTYMELENLQHIPTTFDLIIFDPPVLRFSPTQMVDFFHKNFPIAQKLLLAYPLSFFTRIKPSLAAWKLQEISLIPTYQTATYFNQKEMKFFCNFPLPEYKELF